MDIIHLIDRLEQALNEGQRVWLTAKLVVDEERVYSIVDQMRVSIPDAVKRANRIEAEKDRVLAQAHEEADRIRQLARQEAEDLISRDTIMASAQQRAENIIERARREAAALRHDADAYTIDVLTRLEEDLLRSLAVIRNGLTKLQAEHEVAEAEEPAAD